MRVILFIKESYAETIDKEVEIGTHSSPRQHLRRGHLREYQPGKFCWVRDTTVGLEKTGVIEKEYSLGNTSGPKM